MHRGTRNARIAAVMVALMLMAFLSGCNRTSEYPSDLTLSTALPPNEENLGERDQRALMQLYFVSNDGRKLAMEERMLTYGGEVSRAYAAIEAMLEGPESPSLERSLPDTLALERVELSADVCNIYFSGVYPGDEPWLTARPALAAAVKAAEGIGAVNVFLNGYEPGCKGRALGLAAPISEALDVYLANVEQEYVVLQQKSEAGQYDTRNAALYFADATGRLLVAQNRSITYAVSEGRVGIAKLLLEKLQEGDSAGGGLEPVLPADFQLFQDPRLMYVDMGAGFEDTGNELCYLELSIQRPQSAYDEKIMCAAITLTLTGYIPNIAGVLINVQGEMGVYTSIGNHTFLRGDFTDLIGHAVYMSYPDVEGVVLDRVQGIIPYKSVYDAKARLEALFDGPADPGVMYAGIDAGDIEDVYIAQGVAVVKWKAGFTQKLKDVISDKGAWEVQQDRREVMLVYGVVNTLTELNGISSVWMLEDGSKLGLVENIYLGNALLRNPGLSVQK